MGSRNQIQPEAGAAAGVEDAGNGSGWGRCRREGRQAMTDFALDGGGTVVAVRGAVEGPAHLLFVTAALSHRDFPR